MIAAQHTDHDTRLLAGIRIALRKARELGYPVERMDVTASVEDATCAVHFAPLAKPGRISTGGDLTLSVDPDADAVLTVQRGQ